MSIRNLGQPGLESARPQETLHVTSRGSCRRVFTAAEANGRRAGCRAGTWPRPGRSAWGPLIAFATGDTLELRFDRAMGRVWVSSTTDGPASTTPQHRAGWIERQLIGPAAATPTADSAVWHVRLPDPMEPLVDRTGGTFAVVASDDERSSAFAFSIRTPRPDVFGGTECGRAWYSPRSETSTCSPPAAMPLLAGVGLRVRNERPRGGRVGVEVRTLRGALVVLSLRHRGRVVGRTRPLLVSRAGAQRFEVALKRAFLRRLRRNGRARVRVAARACYDICRVAGTDVLLRP